MDDSAHEAPVAVRILREQQRLELDWRDGHTSAFEATQLRWLCPCAYCRGEAGLPGWLDGNPTLSPSQTRLEGGEMIGSYALCLFWGDGHRTGYYTWSLLRERCSCASCMSADR